jgi:hypothetical protein
MYYVREGYESYDYLKSFVEVPTYTPLIMADRVGIEYISGCATYILKKFNGRDFIIYDSAVYVLYGCALIPVIPFRHWLLENQ